MAIPSIHSLSYQKSRKGESGRAQNNKTLDKSNYSRPIVIKDWRALLEDLRLMGYSLTKIAKIAGVNRKSLQKWWLKTPDYTCNYKVFTRVLYLYCHIKYLRNKKI